MASIADTSTTLAVMQDANNDIVELIRKLKLLIGGQDSVTFTMSGYTITVDSIQKLIDNYRSGKFDSIVLGGQTSDGRQVKLSVTSNGALKVSDASGRLVPIDCAGITSSNIDTSRAKKVVAENCEIRAIKGSTRISGGSLTLDSLSISGNLGANAFTGETVSVGVLNVSQMLSCSGLVCYGSRKLNVSNIRNVFYNGSVIDNESLIIKPQISNNIWDVSASTGSPKDLGFEETFDRIPGIISLQGLNSYDSFKSIRTPINVKVVYQDNDIECDMYSLHFGAVMLWPAGYIDTANNRLVLTPFTTEDSLSSDIYYMTAGEKWTIYRTLTIANGIATFGTPYTLSPFSCTRFIVSVRSTEDTTMSILEIA